METFRKILKVIKLIIPYILMLIFTILIYHYVRISMEKQLDYFTPIINGILSGVVTAVILFIVQIIWRKNVLIWFENLLYQDVCIEGEWSGVLIPYLGLDDLDKISKDIAWRQFIEMRRESIKRERKENKSNETVEASIIDEDTGEEEKISAEVVLSEKESNQSNSGESKKKTIKINLRAAPIVVRFEIKRTGHQISGKMLETGGASQIHSYLIEGSFKNLILSGCYETISKDHIDRGALSLMLFANGTKLEGFFSSYSDGSHKIVPMQCILRKRNQLNDDNNI